MPENITPNQHNNLTRLKRYLNYEISTTVLYFLSFQIFITIFLTSLAALILTPFMLHVLYKKNKKGWLIFFIIIVILPLAVFIILGLLIEFSKPLIFITLGLFYFYCFLLRFEVNNWVKEKSERNQYLVDKKKRDEELKLFTNQFD